MICKHCGAEIAEGVKFCTNCGQKVETETQAQSEPVEDITSYKCPCCGAGLKFDTGVQELKCGSCGNTFSLEVVRSFEKAAQTQRTERCDWGDFDRPHIEVSRDTNLKPYICKSCGAEIITDETTGATNCPYCDSPIVLNDRMTGYLTPDAVIPFKVDKDRLRDILKDFCSKRVFIPKNFFKDQRIEEIKGIYVPFWLFDCSAEGDINYNAEIVRHRSDSRYNYTITDHFLLRRAGNADFEKIPVDGSIKMDDQYMDSIEPFNYDDLVDFNTAYLSGYLADKFDVDAKSSIERANKRVRQSVIEEFKKNTSRYTGVVYRNGNIDIEKGSVKYVLLPVWLVNAKYGDKIYTYAINGQTGKMVGNVPVAWGKFFVTALLFTPVCGIIIYIILMMLG